MFKYVIKFSNLQLLLNEVPLTLWNFLALEYSVCSFFNLIAKVQILQLNFSQIQFTQFTISAACTDLFRTFYAFISEAPWREIAIVLYKRRVGNLHTMSMHMNI